MYLLKNKMDLLSKALAIKKASILASNRSFIAVHISLLHNNTQLLVVPEIQLFCSTLNKKSSEEAQRDQCPLEALQNQIALPVFNLGFSLKILERI